MHYETVRQRSERSPVTMNLHRSDEDWLAELGHRIAAARLRRNWTQSRLAREAGLSRPTIARMEAGQSTQLTNLIRTLRALGLATRLEQLVPAVETRPIEALEGRGPRRQRASGRRAQQTVPEETTWRWGDDT